MSRSDVVSSHHKTPGSYNTCTQHLYISYLFDDIYQDHLSTIDSLYWVSAVYMISTCLQKGNIYENNRNLAILAPFCNKALIKVTPGVKRFLYQTNNRSNSSLLSICKAWTNSLQGYLSCQELPFMISVAINYGIVQCNLVKMHENVHGNLATE